MPALEMDFRLVDLLDNSKAAISITGPFTPGEEELVVMSNLFIDGTDGAMKGLPEKGPPASGMCVIHEMRDGSFRYAG